MKSTSAATDIWGVHAFAILGVILLFRPPLSFVYRSRTSNISLAADLIGDPSDIYCNALAGPYWEVAKVVSWGPESDV